MRNIKDKKFKVKMKEIMKKRVGQSRKKGAILIEMLAAIPVFIFLIWAVMTLMLFLLASSQMNEAAYEVSRSVAMEMRGHEESGDIAAFTTNVEENIALVIQGSGFIEMYKTGHEPVTAYSKTDCLDAYSADERNIVCAYVETYAGTTGKDHYQVVVRLKSDYNVVGGWMPFLEDMISVNARSVAQVELPGRYNYVNY